jgi:hypothetical protein
MRSRLTLFLPLALLGAFLLIVPKSVRAQQPGPVDLGQTGEFEGEHVDTGAAALDQGPEVPELGESETAPLGTTLSRAATPASSFSAHAERSLESTEADLQFDLAEIMAVQIEEIR